MSALLRVLKRSGYVGVLAVAATIAVSPALAVGAASPHSPAHQTYTSPQPASNADFSGHGANQHGSYDSTRNGSPSMNGNGKGQATGKPCAGCVGKADNKNPHGQMPNGSDHNAGYECDRNHGVGRTNPAHTGCTQSSSSPPPGGGCTPTPTNSCTPGSGGQSCTPTSTKPCTPGSGGHSCTPTSTKPCTPGSGGHSCTPTSTKPCTPGSGGHSCTPTSTKPCTPGSGGHSCSGSMPSHKTCAPKHGVPSGVSPTSVGQHNAQSNNGVEAASAQRAAAPQAAASSSGLASTGVRVGLLVVAGTALIAVGALMSAGARRPAHRR